MIQEIIEAFRLLESKGFSLEEIEAIARESVLEDRLRNGEYNNAGPLERHPETIANLIQATGYDPEEVTRFVQRQHLAYHVGTALEYGWYEDVDIALNHWKLTRRSDDSSTY